MEDYRILVNELNDGVFTTDNEGTVLFANKALLEMHGYENPHEFVGRHFLEFVSHELRDEIKERFSSMVQKGENRGNILDISVFRKDGSTISVQLNASPVQEEGRIVGTRGIIREMTDLKRAEEALPSGVAIPVYPG